MPFIRIAMELEEAILNRRSCRSYDQTKHVTREMMREIIHAGTWAPSGTNSQPWRFTVLSSEAKAEFIKLHRTDLESKRAVMKEQVQNIAFWSCTSLEKSDVVVLVWDKEKSLTSPQSVGASIQTMMLKAYSIGIGSLWVAAVRWSREEIMKRYGHPDWELIAGVGIGYQSEKMMGKKGPPRLPVDEVTEFLD
jgi:nitroreductase